MKRLPLLFTLFLLSQLGFSQVDVSGLVKDQNGPIAFANVVLMDSAKAIKSYDITDENGLYSISTTKGTYLIEVSILGYQKWQKEIVLENNQTLEAVLLVPVTNQLEEVVVIKRKPLIERRPDRLIFNVENSIAASGGNVLDALKAAPGVNVTNDAIGLIGRGASQVMIDGRLLQLTGEDLVNFLNSINAADIKEIEIITNPSAKYDAAGNGGLINIIYKKGVSNSWKSTTTLAYNQSTYAFFTLGESFLYSKNKLKVGFNLNGNVGYEREIETYETRYPTAPWKTKLDVKQKKNNLSGRLSLDYDLTKRTTVGAQYFGDFGQPDRTDGATTRIFNNAGGIDSLFRSAGVNDGKTNINIYNVHSVSRIDTLGRKISVDLDYFDYSNKLERGFVVNTFFSNNEFAGVNQAQKNFSNQAIDNFSAKVDVEHPFKFINLAYGAKVSFIKSVNALKTFNTITETPVLDTALSNEFEYDENVQAVYLNGTKKINAKLQMQMGLRAENTITKGVSRTLSQTNNNNYLKFFPTFYVSYQKDENHSFSFNYGKRIRRPNFRDLNPFRSYTNSNSYSEGNPFIRPAFRDLFEFNYAYKETWTTNAFCNFTKGGYGVLFSADPETNVQAITRRNYYNSISAGIGELYTFNTLPWLESVNQLYVLGYKADLYSDVNARPKNGLQLYVGTNNTISFNESTKLQVNFFYSSRYRELLLDQGETYSLDFGLKKSVLKKQVNLSVYVQDVFNTGSPNNMASEINGVEVIYGLNYSRRFVRFSLAYNLGNTKISVKRREFGNDDERRRVGN